MTRIAVREIEASALPDRLDLPGYSTALLVVRYRGLPVGHGEVPVQGGVIELPRLRQAVSELAAGMIAERRLEELLRVERPPAQHPRCTVAVCTRDRPDDLARCLDALMALPDRGQEFVVVDSASGSSATRDVVSRYPRVRYVREERRGADRARNRALREARHEIVAYIDDDAVADPGWLDALCAGFTAPRILAVTGLTMPLELETEAQICFERTNGFGRGYRRVLFDGVEANPFAVARVGASVNLALRRSVVDMIGPFDEALDGGTPSRSGGDHDLFCRILAKGYCIAYEPAALNWHRHRREWAELKSTIYGYGVGVYAFLTARLLRGEWGAPWLAVLWFPWQIRGLIRGVLGRPDAMPPGLALAELRGCLAGPLAYLRSRRRERRA